MGTHPIFESDFDCLTECQTMCSWRSRGTASPSFRRSRSMAKRLGFSHFPCQKSCNARRRKSTLNELAVSSTAKTIPSTKKPPSTSPRKAHGKAFEKNIVEALTEVRVLHDVLAVLSHNPA